MSDLTETEIGEAVRMCGRMDHVSFLSTILREETGLQPYFMALKDHAVVEIGPGQNPITRHFDCRSYSPAEKGYGRPDGLTVLKGKPDRSVVVVSFGVLDDTVLDRRSEDVSRRYIEELVQQIKRVTHPFAILVGADAMRYMGKPDLPALEGMDTAGGVYLAQGVDKLIE